MSPPAPDLYADGWDAGYYQALTDLAAETHRVTDPAGRAQLQRLLEQLRGHVTMGLIR